MISKIEVHMKFIDNRRYFYYSELPYEIMPIYHNQIKSFTSMLALEYSGFSNWFKGLFEADYKLSAQREIIICEKDFQLAGIAILKSGICEKKICTLRVDRRFRNLGIGGKLIELSLEWLGDDKPLITVQKYKEPQYRSLFSRYGFELEQENRNYYRLFSTELAYNGELPSKRLVYGRIKMVDLSGSIKQYIRAGKGDINTLFNWTLAKQISKYRGI